MFASSSLAYFVIAVVVSHLSLGVPLDDVIETSSTEQTGSVDSADSVQQDENPTTIDDDDTLTATEQDGGEDRNEQILPTVDDVKLQPQTSLPPEQQPSTTTTPPPPTTTTTVPPSTQSTVQQQQQQQRVEKPKSDLVTHQNINAHQVPDDNLQQQQQQQPVAATVSQQQQQQQQQPAPTVQSTAAAANSKVEQKVADKTPSTSAKSEQPNKDTASTNLKNDETAKVEAKNPEVVKTLPEVPVDKVKVVSDTTAKVVNQQIKAEQKDKKEASTTAANAQTNKENVEKSKLPVAMTTTGLTKDSEQDAGGSSTTGEKLASHLSNLPEQVGGLFNNVLNFIKRMKAAYVDKYIITKYNATAERELAEDEHRKKRGVDL